MSELTSYQNLSLERVYEFFADFNGTEESVKSDVQLLKEWIRKTPYLPNIEDDEWLRNLLLKCKNNMQRTKSTLKNYFIAKTSMPEIFQNRDPYNEGIEFACRNFPVFMCRKLTPEGDRIAIFNAFQKPENRVQVAENILKVMQLSNDLALKLYPSRCTIVIINLENITPTFVVVFLPLMKKLLTLGTKVMPNRYRKIYLLNTASYMDKGILLAKSLMSKKLSQRMEVWNDKVTNLATVLPKKVLPMEFGGDDISLSEMKDLWYEELKKHREWIRATETQTADLKKILKNTPSYDQIVSYEMEGSFRRLSVD